MLLYLRCALCFLKFGITTLHLKKVHISTVSSIAEWSHHINGVYFESLQILRWWQEAHHNNTHENKLFHIGQVISKLIDILFYLNYYIF